MSGKRYGAGRRAFRLALLWLAVVIACAGLGRQLLALESRARWEQDVRSGMDEDMAAYEVRDPGAWAAHQRRAGARIAGLRRQQGITRALFFGVALLGWGAAMWLLWPEGPKRTRTEPE